VTGNVILYFVISTCAGGWCHIQGEVEKRIKMQADYFHAVYSTKNMGFMNSPLMLNCYQPELNTCFWMEQRKMRKRQRNSWKDWETWLPGNGACQSSHSCVAAWFPSVSSSIARVSDW
jgi:hypothetical protein